MPSGSTHQIAGALAGLGICLVDDSGEKQEPLPPLAAATVGALVGKLPDQLEPALHPNHRQFFHCVLVFGLLGYGIDQAYCWEPQSTTDVWVRRALLVAGASYLSHLALDALTKRSLPLVGNL